MQFWKKSMSRQPRVPTKEVKETKLLMQLWKKCMSKQPRVPTKEVLLLQEKARRHKSIVVIPGE